MTTRAILGQRTKSTSWRTAVFAAVAAVALSSAPAVHAAPPIGPPAPTPVVKELPIELLITNLRDKTGKNIGVRGQVDTAIANANANASQQTNVRAKIRVESFKTFAVGMAATTYTDRPNEFYARIPYMVTYLVYDVDKHTDVGWVPTTVTRRLSQSITVSVSCDRWETGNGALKLGVAIDRPYLEDNQGTVEQVVDFFVAGHLTSFIDGQVRQLVNAIPIAGGAGSLGLQCNALGADAGAPETAKDDIVRYSFNATKWTPPVVGSELSVTLDSIKRLPAHDQQGRVLYAASETPTLEVFANQLRASVALPAMQEGQQVPVTAAPLVLPTAGLATLALLVNVRQGVAQVDSASQSHGPSDNFGNGPQTIRVRKSYWTQANPAAGVKPQQQWVDAYELAFHVNAPGKPVLANPGTSPPAPTPPSRVLPATVKPGVLAPR